MFRCLVPVVVVNESYKREEPVSAGFSGLMVESFQAFLTRRRENSIGQFNSISSSAEIDVVISNPDMCFWKSIWVHAYDVQTLFKARFHHLDRVHIEVEFRDSVDLDCPLTVACIDGTHMAPQCEADASLGFEYFVRLQSQFAIDL